MTTMVIHPRLAPAGKLRLWLGIFDTESLPDRINWSVDGKAVSPTVIKPLTAAHPHRCQTFTGVFEIDDAGTDNAQRLVQAAVPGLDSAQVHMRALPGDIAHDDWLRILLVSCYHQAEDRSGLTAQTFENIAAAAQPDLSLLMGDQVYLDLPTLNNFPDNEAKLAAKFETAYRTNWTARNGLTCLLSAAPSVSCPDDHEYWNNFPHTSPIIQNSWKADSRRRWQNAADQMFDAYQAAAPCKRGDNVEVNIDPLSILVLDQRSQRRDDRKSTLGENGLQHLNDWVDRLIANKQYGAVVTGQSLLDKPVSNFTGRVADWMLPNYDDYGDIVRALSRLADAGRPVLLLTGDVHWGRITRIRKAGVTKFIEIICSPTSLVTSIGVDQQRWLGAGFRRYFLGEETRWPRHSEAPDAEDYLAPQIFGKTYKTETLYKHRGDQLAMLALRRDAGILEAKVTYYEIHKEPQRPREVYLGRLRGEN